MAAKMTLRTVNIMGYFLSDDIGFVAGPFSQKWHPNGFKATVVMSSYDKRIRDQLC